VQAFAEELEPIDWLPAEHEADVPRGDVSARE
jgi:hypothetical protein